jgi:hypothetical protein
MNTESAREFRVSLKIRWRDVLLVLTTGIGFLALGGILTESVGVASKWVLASVVVGLGGLLLGVAGYLNWTITQGENALRNGGFPWKVDRTLLPFERRTLTTPLSRDEALSRTLMVLKEPILQLRNVRRTRQGARADRPPVLRSPGQLIADVIPLDVQVRLRPRGMGSEVALAIQPDLLVFRVGSLRSRYSWVSVAESLADQLLTLLKLRMKAP